MQATSGKKRKSASVSGRDARMWEIRVWVIHKECGTPAELSLSRDAAARSLAGRFETMSETADTTG
jgi:hypothetical protein